MAFIPKTNFPYREHPLRTVRRLTDQALDDLGGLVARTESTDADDKTVNGLVLRTPRFSALTPSQLQKVREDFVKKFVALLEKENAAYDIGGYKAAPPGLRIWCGATVDAADLEKLTPWLDWAFAETVATLG